MLKKRERVFIPGLLEFHAKAKNQPVVTPPSLRLLMDAVETNETEEVDTTAYWRHSNGDVYASSQVVQIERTDDYVLFLLNYANGDLTDPAFRNKINGSIRKETCGENEQLCFGCHLLVSLHPQANDQSAYLMVSEEVRGISRTTVRRVIEKVFRLTSRHFRIEDTNKPIRIRSVFQPYVSESLSDGLDNGVLRTIQLINDTPTGMYEKVVQTRLTAVWKITEAEYRTGNWAKDKLLAIIRLGKRNRYNKLRLALEKDHGQQSEVFSEEFPINDLNEEELANIDLFEDWDLAERRYEKFDEDLEQAPNEVVPAIKNAMLRILRREQNG